MTICPHCGKESADHRISRLGLTRVQADALAFISSYLQFPGYSPSYHEIKDAVGLKSTSGAHRVVVHLEERGHIVRHPGRSRSISLRGAA